MLFPILMSKKTWVIGLLAVLLLLLITSFGGNSDGDKALLVKIDALEDRVNEAELELLWLHYCVRRSHDHNINDESYWGSYIESAIICDWGRTDSEFEVGGKAHVRHDSEWGI